MKNMRRAIGGILGKEKPKGTANRQELWALNSPERQWAWYYQARENPETLWDSDQRSRTNPNTPSEP